MKEVNESIDQLHEQMQNTEVSDEHKGHLDDIEGYIHLVRTEPEGGHHRSLKEKLQLAVVYFDTGHPELATTMRSTLTTLSNAGV